MCIQFSSSISNRRGKHDNFTLIPVSSPDSIRDIEEDMNRCGIPISSGDTVGKSALRMSGGMARKDNFKLSTNYGGVF